MAVHHYYMFKMGRKRGAEIEEFARRILDLEPEDLCWLLSPIVGQVGHRVCRAEAAQW